MAGTILSRERSGFSQTLAQALEARKILSRDAAVNQLVAANIPPEAVDFCDLTMELKVHEDAFPADLDASEVAAETCRRLAAALNAAADGIKPPHRSGSRASDYAA